MFSLLAKLASAEAIRLLVLSDLHLDAQFNCSKHLGSCTDMGKFGKDAPYGLLTEVLEEAVKVSKEEGVEAVLFTGDFLKANATDYIWKDDPKAKKSTLSLAQDAKWFIENEFSRMPIRSAIGDTDGANFGTHYQDFTALFCPAKHNPSSFGESGFYRIDLA